MNHHRKTLDQWLALVVGLGAILFLAVGCSSISEPDRHLEDQTIKGTDEIDRIVTTFLPAGHPVIAMVRIVTAVQRANGLQLQRRVLGVPKDPQPFNATFSADMVKKSEESHSSPWTPIIAAAGTAALFLLRKVVALKFPFLSFLLTPAERAPDAVIAGVAKAREKAKVVKVQDEHGVSSEVEMIPRSVLDGYLEFEQEKAKVEGWTKKRMRHIEEKLGLDPSKV